MGRPAASEQKFAEEMPRTKESLAILFVEPLAVESRFSWSKNRGLRTCSDHTLITPERSVVVGSRIGTAVAYLECASYDWIGRGRVGRNGFDSRYTLVRAEHPADLIARVWTRRSPTFQRLGMDSGFENIRICGDLRTRPSKRGFATHGRHQGKGGSTSLLGRVSQKVSLSRLFTRIQSFVRQRTCLASMRLGSPIRRRSR